MAGRSTTVCVPILHRIAVFLIFENAAGPYQQAFSNMAGTAANRKTFINNMMKFMDTYGFDGMDLDWEYPTAGKFQRAASKITL